MRKIVMYIFLYCILSIGYTQPVLDSTNFNATIGQMIVLKKSYNYHTIQNGSNIVWDFSDYDTSSFETDTIEFAILDSLCNGLFLPDGNYFGVYPNSNIHIVKGNTVQNFENSFYGYYIEGSAGCNSYFGVYTNLKKIMDFPFTYNSLATDFFEGVVPDFPWPYNYFTGNVTITANAYGTLILPDLIFDNVLKISTIQIYQNPPIPPDTTYYDTWYSVDIPYPVLEITNKWYTKYISDVITESNIGQSFNVPIDIYPNPVTTNLTIDLIHPRGNITYSILDLFGTLIITDRFNQTEKKKIIEFHNFGTGIYFVRIEYEGKMIVKKIIKT